MTVNHRRIGFCIPCRDRLWQLEQTLPDTLTALSGTTHVACLFDFASSDGLEDWIATHHAPAIEQGHLRYFRTEDALPWHVCQAKNTAHRLARASGADYLVNLDADNILAPDDLAWLSDTLARRPNLLLHQWTLGLGDGSFGRIGMPTEAWWALGGYDESFAPMGWQDFDLLLRGRLAALEYLRHPATRPAIPNSVSEKIAAVEGLARSGDDQSDYDAMNLRNMAHSFSRPPRLSPDEQRRFSGRLDFRETTTV